MCLYTVVGCVAAYWQLVFGGDSLFAAALATLLLTHTTIFSGLLTHEAMHNTLVGGKVCFAFCVIDFTKKKKTQLCRVFFFFF